MELRLKSSGASCHFSSNLGDQFVNRNKLPAGNLIASRRMIVKDLFSEPAQQAISRVHAAFPEVARPVLVAPGDMPQILIRARFSVLT